MIYLNNAATSFPKPQEVISTITNTLEHGLYTYNRSNQFNIEKDIYNLRNKLGNIIKAKEKYNICFTNNATTALNTIFLGMLNSNYLRKGDYIITSVMEHNSVSRCLMNLVDNLGINILKIPFKDNTLDYQYLEDKINDIRIKNKIKLVFLNHGSNITGDVIDLIKVSNIIKKENLLFGVDASQTLGCYPIDVEKMQIDLLAFPGHKALLGPQGTGGFYIREKVKVLSPILFGGTGNTSIENDTKIIYPDSFEVGTPAIHNLLGLLSSVEYIENIGINNIIKKEQEDIQYITNKLSEYSNVIIYGNFKKSIGVLSFNINNYLPQEVGEILLNNDIICRTGFHCSLWANQFLGTDKLGGTVRISPSYFTKKEEIDTFLNILIKKIILK